MAKKIGYLAFDVVRNEWLARVGFTCSPRFKTRKAAERWLENKGATDLRTPEGLWLN